jgi:hypothetical protein
MAGGRVSDSRPWLGKKQALSEQDHGNWGPPRNKTHGAWDKCIDNHHYRYRATPCRSETKKDSKTPGQDPGIQSYDSSKGIVKARTTSLLSSLSDLE